MGIIKNTQDFSPEFLFSNYGHWAVIGLGTNLGDRSANLLRAISLLINQGVRVLAMSNVYQTAPEDYLEQSPFLNMVILVVGNNLLKPCRLLKVCLDIEIQLKRERRIPKGPRTIDLDLLIYDNLKVDSPKDLPTSYLDESGISLDLVLPHPRMHLRGFVLAPLAELIPNTLHPILGISYQTLLEKLDLADKVAIYQG